MSEDAMRRAEERFDARFPGPYGNASHDEPDKASAYLRQRNA